MIRLLLFLITVIPSQPALATLAQATLTPKEPKNTLIQWIKINDSKFSAHSHLRIQLFNSLSERQKSILSSGFSTLSHIELQMSDSNTFIASLSCSVRYDLWDETFEITIHNKENSTKTVKSIDNYADACLSIELKDENIINRLSKGGILKAIIQIEQISAEQATKIKEWLVEQQSTVMQGLFSHMLGELTLTKTTSINLAIPRQP